LTERNHTGVKKSFRGNNAWSKKKDRTHVKNVMNKKAIKEYADIQTYS